MTHCRSAFVDLNCILSRQNLLKNFLLLAYQQLWSALTYRPVLARNSRAVIFMAYFHQWKKIPDTHIYLKPLVKPNIWRTFFYWVISVIWIGSILIFVVLALIAYFANPYWNLSDLLKRKPTISITSLELIYYLN